MIWTWTKAENSSFRTLNIPELSILSDLGLSFLELILWDSLALNRSRVSFYLTDESLVIDFNRQNFRILIWIEWVLILNLLFLWSWILPFMVLSHVQLFTWGYLTIFGREALPVEDSLFLWRPSTPFNSNNNLIPLCIFLIDCVIPVHFNNLTDLNCRVTSVLCLEVCLFIEFVLSTMIITSPEKGCWFWVHSLLVICNWGTERITSSLWSLFSPTSKRLFTTFSVLWIYFLRVRKWMHPLSLNSSCPCFIILHAISSPEYLIRVWSWRCLIGWIVLITFDITGLVSSCWD